jgi:hypothetical protein
MVENSHTFNDDNPRVGQDEMGGADAMPGVENEMGGADAMPGVENEMGGADAMPGVENEMGGFSGGAGDRDRTGIANLEG